MRKTLSRLSVVALVVVLVAGFGASHAVRAQDAMTAKVTCDSDLILSLYTAEYHFDFAAVEDKMMAADSAMPHIDLAAYDEGQYAPLFESMMAMMDSSMGMGMLDEATMTSVMDAMSMDQTAMNQAMMEMTPEASSGDVMAATAEAGSGDMMAMTTLAPATVAGEAPECTALRDELRHFYTALAYANMTMAQSK